VQLQGVTLTASYAVDAQTIVSKNVAGRVVGSAHPEQTVMYSAHWDHLGVGLPDAKGDKIYNGAVDNATGIAALLELARAYGKAPAPQRSVLFLAVTAEEKVCSVPSTTRPIRCIRWQRRWAPSIWMP
jgi:Zn-dependent M28 family amino/carboxypeptidase